MDGEMILIQMKPEQFQQIIEDTVSRAFIKQNLTNQVSLEQDSEKLLTRREVMELLSISAVTLWQRMRDGSIQYMRIGRRLVFSKQDLMRDLEQTKIKGGRK